MPIKGTFKRQMPGFAWDSRRKVAKFLVKHEGRRVLRVLPFDSVEDARSAFPAFRADVRAGKYDQGDEPEIVAQRAATGISGADSAVTFAEYVTAHWDSLHVKCAASTQASNRNSLDYHLLPFFGEKAMTAIDIAACEDFTASMKRKGMSAPTTNFALRLLRKVCHHARRRKVMAEVPEFREVFLKEERLALEMNESEQDAFLASFDDRAGFMRYLAETQKRSGKVVRSARFGFNERRFGGGLKPDSDAADVYFSRFQRSKLLFVAALDTGLRETDLRLLKRTSVDLSKGIVTVTTTKTGKTAIIALSDRCRKVMVEAMSQPVASTEYVFTTDVGKPYSVATINRYYSVAKRLAGITRRCRLNDLRHTFASNLANDGCNLLIIRDALGHTTTRMSERYAKPGDAALEVMRASLNRRATSAASTTRGTTRAANE